MAIRGILAIQGGEAAIAMVVQRSVAGGGGGLGWFQSKLEG